MSVTYEAVLDVSEDGVAFVAGLLDAERVRRGTRSDTRALDTRAQAVLVLRWFLDDTRMSALAMDNAISSSTAYTYRDEGIAVLAARRPSLHGALLAAKIAGHSQVIVDGTLIYTDRISVPGPTPGVDLWWSGKHKHHGGNIQVVSAPDGWPLWTSDVQPGREHDITAARGRPAAVGGGGGVGHRQPAGPGRSGLPRRDRDLHHPAQEAQDRAAHDRPTDLQRRPWSAALPGGTRQLPAQDHLQGAPPLPR